jgi:hypothetical protein
LRFIIELKGVALSSSGHIACMTAPRLLYYTMMTFWMMGLAGIGIVAAAFIRGSAARTSRELPADIWDD